MFSQSYSIKNGGIAEELHYLLIYNILLQEQGEIKIWNLEQVMANIIQNHLLHYFIYEIIANVTIIFVRFVDNLIMCTFVCLFIIILNI